MSDIKILERWRVERDASAFNEIVTSHSSMVYATCRRILGNSADAEDLTQECFLRLSKDDNRITESLGGWLHTLATRRSISLLRSEKRRQRRETRYAAVAPAVEDPTWDDVQAHVDECIAALPGELRDPIIAHFLERQTQQAIADASGISKSSVSRRIEKGVEAIRVALKERGISLAAAPLATMLLTESAIAAPLTLSASLGKIAIVGAHATTATNAALLGGAIMTKQTALIAVLTLTVVTGTFVMFRSDNEGPSVEESALVASNDDSSLAAQDTSLATTTPPASDVNFAVSIPQRVSLPATQDRRRACAQKLLQIGRAILRWSNEHEGRYPERFSDLYPDYVSDLTLFACPIASGGNETRVTLENLDAASDYLLFTNLSSTQPSHSVVLAHDNPENHGGAGCNVLYLDGHVEYPEECPDLNSEPESFAGNDAKLGDLVIAGVVNDTSGDPIESVFVQGFGGGGNPHTYTDSEGAFRLIGLAEGLYRLRLQDDKHTGESFLGIRAGEENLVFVLRDRAAVSGIVVNAVTRRPISKFELYAAEGIQGRLARTMYNRFVAFNDPQGRFQIENVPLGDSTLIVRARGYTPAFEAFRLDSSAPIDRVTIALQPGLSVEGQVLTVAGETIPNAWIFKAPIPAPTLLNSLEEEATQNPRLFVDALSDGEGRYTIDSLSLENQSLAAFHPEFGYGEVALRWNGSRLSGVDIVLNQTETGSLEVLVTTDGVPGVDSVVWVSAVGGSGDILQRERTDADGRVFFDEIPPGVWGLTAVYPGQTNSWQRRIVVECEVVANQTTQEAIDFHAPSASLTGTVTLDGERAIGGNVMLTLTRPEDSETYMATWGDDGTFTIIDIVPGAGTLALNVVFNGERSRSKSIDLEFVDGDQKVIDIDLSGGLTLSGVMQGVAATEHGTVAALRGEHEITEVTLEWMTSIQPFAAGSSQVAADGTYSIEGLEPGIHTLLALVTKTRSSDAFDDMRWTSIVVEVSDTSDNTIDFDMR